MSLLPGARGILAEEEERLFKLRQEIEGEARQELDRARLELEEEGRATMSGKLCATPFGVDVVGITEFIALTGALVGGTHPFSIPHRFHFSTRLLQLPRSALQYVSQVALESGQRHRKLHTTSAFALPTA
jgi:hypothetical protein